MFSDNIDNISDFLTFDRVLIPNTITIIITIFLLVLTLKGSVEWKVMLFVYGITMTILTLLGVDSDFNVITLMVDFVEDLVLSLL